jgi:hypothetical protein
LKKGLYDQNVSAPEALTDVDQFFSTLDRVHPKLLAKLSREDYTRLKKRTVEAVIGKTDARGQISLDDVAYPLYNAAASFQDGHTSVRWMPSYSNPAGKRFPCFRLAFENGPFLIAVATNREIEDAELLSVNGTPVLEFLRPILDRCSGETLVFRAARFLEQQQMWYYLSNLFGSAPLYRLKLRLPSGIERQVPLKTLSFAQYKNFQVNPLVRPFRPNHEGTRVEFLEPGNIAHLLYSSFRMSEEEKKKIDEIFRQIHDKKCRDLMIDLRGNSGGNSGRGEHIFKYLYSGKFHSFSRMEVKFSPDVRDLLTRSGFAGDNSRRYGRIVVKSSRERRVSQAGGVLLRAQLSAD